MERVCLNISNELKLRSLSFLGWLLFCGVILITTLKDLCLDCISEAVVLKDAIRRRLIGILITEHGELIYSRHDTFSTCDDRCRAHLSDVYFLRQFFRDFTDIIPGRCDRCPQRRDLKLWRYLSLVLPRSKATKPVNTPLFG